MLLAGIMKPWIGAMVYDFWNIFACAGGEFRNS
jgi:hypothetical protein